MPTKKIKNKKIGRKQPAEKPLTLSSLVHYNNKMFLPALELRFATKSDLNGVKSDLNDVKFDLYEVKLDLNEVKTDVKILKEKTDTIMGALDQIIKNTSDLDQEHTMQINTNQRVDKKIENHEKRINKLETAVK